MRAHTDFSSFRQAREAKIGVVGDTDAAGLSDAFEAGPNVHPIAEDMAFLSYDVAEVIAYAQLDPVLGWDPRIALRDSRLLLDRATRAVPHTAELDQNSVAGMLDNATAVFSDLSFQEFTSMSMDPGERGFLLEAHEPAAAASRELATDCTRRLDHPRPAGADRGGARRALRCRGHIGTRAWEAQITRNSGVSASKGSVMGSSRE
jgi:hypothetical protein